MVSFTFSLSDFSLIAHFYSIEGRVVRARFPSNGDGLMSDNFRVYDGDDGADRDEFNKDDASVGVDQGAGPEPTPDPEPEPKPGPEKKTGRWWSVYNAATHWLTSKLLWIPGEVKGLAEDLRKRCQEFYKPSNSAMDAEIEIVVTSQVLMARCVTADDKRTAVRVAEAVPKLTERRAQSACRLGDQLLYDPIDRKPAPDEWSKKPPKDPGFRARVDKLENTIPGVIVSKLKRTLEGVDWMIGRLVENRDLVQTGRITLPVIREIALLQGIRPERSVTDLAMREIMRLAKVAGDPRNKAVPKPQMTDGVEAWDQQLHDAMPTRARQVPKAREMDQEVDEDYLAARAALVAMIDGVIAGLEALRPQLVLERDLALSTAQGAALVDDTPEGRTRHRYYVTHHNNYRKAIARLDALKAERDAAASREQDGTASSCTSGTTVTTPPECTNSQPPMGGGQVVEPQEDKASQDFVSQSRETEPPGRPRSDRQEAREKRKEERQARKRGRKRRR
jgi:hypothetical protein